MYHGFLLCFLTVQGHVATGPVAFFQLTLLAGALILVMWGPLDPRFLKITFGYQEPKPFFESGALFQLKLKRIFWVQGHFWRLGPQIFLN